MYAPYVLTLVVVLSFQALLRSSGIDSRHALKLNVGLATILFSIFACGAGVWAAAEFAGQPSQAVVRWFELSADPWAFFMLDIMCLLVIEAIAHMIDNKITPKAAFMRVWNP